MNQPADVPIPPDLSRRYGGSTTGRDWLASLPELVRHCLAQWQLDLDLPPGALPWNGHGAMVVPVRGDGSGGNVAAALKIAYPHDEARAERDALTLWGGNGAVQLLANDAGAGALLLERLDAARSLQDESMDVAVPVWGAVVRRLSLMPDDRQEWHEFGHIAARAEQWSDELPETWELLARPFPRWLLEAALEVCQTRGAVGRRSGKDVLVHTDLHYLNILARPETAAPSGAAPSGEAAGAEGFAAIDPQPMIGEAEFAVAPLLWNRIPELSRADPLKALLERCLDFSTAAGLDPETARQWALVREVENALDYAAKPHHEGDLARSLWVASTLAGRTLPELPPPHELPGPGEGVARRTAERR